MTTPDRGTASLGLIVCPICGDTFTLTEWERRHSNSDGVDVHGECCDVCDVDDPIGHAIDLFDPDSVAAVVELSSDDVDTHGRT